MLTIRWNGLGVCPFTFNSTMMTICNSYAIPVTGKRKTDTKTIEKDVIKREASMHLSRARQLQLLTVNPVYYATNNATSRNAYGHSAEVIVSRQLKLQLIPINSNCDLCFDAEDEGGCFYEIKFIRSGGKLPVYQWRLAKELCQVGNAYYALLEHNLRGCDPRRDIFSLLSQNWRRIVVVPLSVIKQVYDNCQSGTHRPVDRGRQFGYTRSGYIEGYRNLSLKEIIHHPQTVIHENRH